MIAVAAAFDPAGGLTLRPAAIAGADRAEHTGLWWDDVRGTEQIQQPVISRAFSGLRIE